jgi:hypothetical protein
MERLVSNRGEHFVHLERNQDIESFMDTFDDDFHIYLDNVGGLQGLLSKCTVFSFDERQKNVMFLTERKEQYNEYKRGVTKSLDIEPPTCENVLFAQNNLITGHGDTKGGADATSSNSRVDNNYTDNIFDILKKNTTTEGIAGAKSSRLEIEEMPNGNLSDGDYDDDEEEDDGKPLCSVNSGVQVNTYNDELENRKVMNAKLMDKIKELREENNKLVERQKNSERELQRTQQQLHNEIAEYRKSNEV